jgi:hypothetical protein
LLLPVDPAREDHQQKLSGVKNEAHCASIRTVSGIKPSTSDSSPLPVNRL